MAYTLEPNETESLRTIRHVNRVKGWSPLGNPQFQVGFTDGTYTYTKADSQVGYVIRNPEYSNREVRVVTGEYGHITHIEIPV